MQVYKELFDEDNNKSSLKSDADVETVIKSLIEIDKIISKKFIYGDKGQFVPTSIIT